MPSIRKYVFINVSCKCFLNLLTEMIKKTFNATMRCLWVQLYHRCVGKLFNKHLYCIYYNCLIHFTFLFIVMVYHVFFIHLTNKGCVAKLGCVTATNSRWGWQDNLLEPNPHHTNPLVYRSLVFWFSFVGDRAHKGKPPAPNQLNFRLISMFHLKIDI